MTAATKLKKEDTLKLSPAPEMPSAPPAELPPLADELAAVPMSGPTLADAALSSPPATSMGAPEESEAPPMTPEQIIGLVSELSAFGLPAGLAAAYKEDFKSNSLVQLGVQFSGLAEALAAYGMTGAGGKMPEWLSVALGVAVLGYGVYSTRSKYVETLPDASRRAEEMGGAGFDPAGYSNPVPSSDFGFSGAGEGSGG